MAEETLAAWRRAYIVQSLQDMPVPERESHLQALEDQGHPVLGSFRNPDYRYRAPSDKSSSTSPDSSSDSSGAYVQLPSPYPGSNIFAIPPFGPKQALSYEEFKTGLCGDMLNSGYYVNYLTTFHTFGGRFYNEDYGILPLPLNKFLGRYNLRTTDPNDGRPMSGIWNKAEVMDMICQVGDPAWVPLEPDSYALAQVEWTKHAMANHRDPNEFLARQKVSLNPNPWDEGEGDADMESEAGEYPMESPPIQLPVKAKHYNRTSELAQYRPGPIPAYSPRNLRIDEEIWPVLGSAGPGLEAPKFPANRPKYSEVFSWRSTAEPISKPESPPWNCSKRKIPSLFDLVLENPASDLILKSPIKSSTPPPPEVAEIDFGYAEEYEPESILEPAEEPEPEPAPVTPFMPPEEPTVIEINNWNTFSSYGEETADWAGYDDSEYLSRKEDPFIVSVARMKFDMTIENIDLLEDSVTRRPKILVTNKQIMFECLPNSAASSMPSRATTDLEGEVLDENEDDLVGANPVPDPELGGSSPEIRKLEYTKSSLFRHYSSTGNLNEGPLDLPLKVQGSRSRSASDMTSLKPSEPAVFWSGEGMSKAISTVGLDYPSVDDLVMGAQTICTFRKYGV